jgi:hypothetical protein
MKINKMFALCGILSALCLSVGNLSAQDNGNTNGANAGGRPGGGGPGGRNFDPAQFQQRMMDNVKERLGFTNETEWSAVQPLVQKVMDARRDMGGFGGGFRRGGGGGNQDNGGGRRGGFGGEPSPEAEALQKAIDANAPTSQIKSALEKYRSSQKDKEAKLEQAQANLRKVLTSKQEAQAVLLGLLK